MIDVNEYPLIYTCKSTGKKVGAKVVGEREMAILDDGVVTKYSVYTARKLFRGSRENRKAKNKPSHVRPGISRGGGRHSRKFNEYLDESLEKISLIS